ncbi:hypothetical protein DNI75_24040, partial [Salmonella enterica subsp. enterica]|nr:hypothetical protein [Salmonella enterica subsp. enterica]ECC9255075.1 hypothetical protein [Salmonella enterica subsp. enterica]
LYVWCRFQCAGILREGVVSSYDRTRNVICTECRNSVTMQRVLAFYRGHHREAKSA